MEMGYIAPVTNYQYMQYAERESIETYNPFHITPIARTKPILNTSRNGSTLKWEGEEKARKINRPSQVRSEIAEEIYSDITGKGKYFNEYV